MIVYFFPLQPSKSPTTTNHTFSYIQPSITANTIYLHHLIHYLQKKQSNIPTLFTYSSIINRMSKKENYFCFFQSCLTPKTQQSQLLLKPQSPKQSQEPKSSLRQNLLKTQSSNSNSFFNKKSLSRNKTEYCNRFLQTTKQEGFGHKNRLYNSPCGRYIAERIPVKEACSVSAAKTAVSTPVNLSQFQQPLIRCYNQIQTETTARIIQPQVKLIKKSSRGRDSDLQHTKHFSRPSFGTGLNGFKQSVVSINNSQTVHEKFQESQVMIDYFHPPVEKVSEIHSYLQSRN